MRVMTMLVILPLGASPQRPRGAHHFHRCVSAGRVVLLVRRKVGVYLQYQRSATLCMLVIVPALGLFS